LAITETPYYILNSQSPIARLPEIIFHDFLFTIMILELFGLMFLIFKLAIIPIIFVFIRKCKPDCGIDDCEERSSGHRSSDGDLKTPTSNSNEHKSREDRSSQHRSSHGDLKIPTSKSNEQKFVEDSTEPRWAEQLKSRPVTAPSPLTRSISASPPPRPARPKTCFQTPTFHKMFN